MKTIGIIPARYDSSRFPGKPLAIINNKPMIRWVYESLLPVVDVAIVATDNDKIFKTVIAFGGKAVITSSLHKSGTDRVAEAYNTYCNETKEEFDVILNIQGDEPMLNSNQVIELRDCFLDNSTQMATLASVVSCIDDLHQKPGVFLVTDKDMNAIYFSRHPIPFAKSLKKESWLTAYDYKHHIGLYGFTPKVLDEFISLPESGLEKIEGLEQLRWIENGGKIKVAISPYTTHPVDYPEDIKILEEKLSD